MIMTQFTRRAPKVATSNNGRIFGGRENNQVGDTLTGIFAGVTEPMGSFKVVGYIFLDESANYEKVMIFGCESLKKQMSYYQIGDRIQVTIEARFIGSAKSMVPGKTVVIYDVQVDETYEPTQEILDMCDAAIAKPVGAQATPPQQPVAKKPMPVAPQQRTPREPVEKKLDPNNPFPV